MSDDRPDWSRTPPGYRSPYPVKRFRFQRFPALLIVGVLAYAALVAAEKWPQHVAPVVRPVERQVEHLVESGFKVADRVVPGWRPSPEQVAPYKGVVSVIDGDTIELHGQRFRLAYADAPESDQVCRADGERYRCGQLAANALDGFIAGRAVMCQPKGKSYDRIVAVCHVGEQDLAEWMVFHGFAVAEPTYGLAYVGVEAQAKAAQRGLWRGEFVLPKLHRKGVRLP